MSFTLLSSIFTALSLAVFIGIIYWAYSRSNKERFEAIARLPIDNEEPTGN